MKTKMFFLLLITFGHISYAAEESKSETIAPFDLTPIPDLSPPREDISVWGNNRPILKKYQLRYDPDETDSDEEIYPYIPKTNKDGSYKYIDEKSPEFKKRKQRVERTVATTRDSALKKEHFIRTTRCYGFEYPRSPLPKDPESFCWKHRCKYKDCIRLFAYQAFLLETDYAKRQAYLLGPKCHYRRIGPTLAAQEAKVHEIGRLAALREVAPKSPGSKPMSVVRYLQKRSLGIK